jgi:hypothetical protein
MSNKNTPPFLGLSVDIVFRILDHLEISTILLSFRNVCTRFNTIIDTYHRYQVNYIFSFSNYLLFYLQICTKLDLTRQGVNDRKLQSLCDVLQTDTVRDVS